METVVSNNIFTSVGNIKALLLRNFYTDSQVIDELCSIIQKNNSYVSSLSYCPENNSLQIQFRKAYVSKVNDGNDGMSYYNSFNDSLNELFSTFNDRLIEMFGEEFINVNSIIRCQTNMLYNIARMGPNTVILFL